jgi:hypothetical protein
MASAVKTGGAPRPHAQPASRRCLARLAQALRVIYNARPAERTGGAWNKPDQWTPALNPVR